MDGRWDERGLKEEDRDQLTGILKKSRLEAQIASQMRGKRGGTLFLCDVDHMNGINEQYGHQAGDEFVIFMPECREEEQAQEICRRIEERFHGGKGNEKGRIPLSLTVVWVMREMGCTYERMLACAWEKMKQQKQIGRLDTADHYITDVRRVRKELTEQIVKEEAYCQDYDTFKSIYRFLERGIARSGQKACVILLTVVDGQGKSPLPYEKDVLMEQLGEDIGMTLRLGDVYTRYSSSQYLLLVIDTTEGQADRIVERIRERFIHGRQGEDVLIHHCFELQSVRSEKGTE